MTADQRNARPVSGEIMTGAAQTEAAGPRREIDGEVLDAEFEVLPRFGKHVPMTPRQNVATAAPLPPLEGMGMLRKPDVAPDRPVTRGSPLFWTFGVVIACAAFWVSGGHALVRHAPLFASASSAPPLGIDNLTTRVDASGQNPVLFVDGEAINSSANPATLTPLIIHVTGNDGAVTLYTLGTSGHTLAPGQRFAFSSRLDVPRNGIRTVSVTFAEQG